MTVRAPGAISPGMKPAVGAGLIATALGVTAAFIAWGPSGARHEATADRDPPTAERSLERDTPTMPKTSPALLASAQPERSPSPSSAPAASPDDAERAAVLEIRSLVADGRIGAARSRASAYYERFPNGPATTEIARLTGAHPTTDRVR